MPKSYDSALNSFSVPLLLSLDPRWFFQKEPKLARARQIPEWDEYDKEIARFTRELAAEGKIHSRMATADASVLAGNGETTAAADNDAEKELDGIPKVQQEVQNPTADDAPTRDEL